MPLKCCVTGCNSNYKRKTQDSDYVTVYRIRSECKGDDSKLQNWLKKIPREHLEVTDHTVVCIKHFAPQFIITHDSATRSDGTVLTLPRRVPKLTADSYPSLFENCPQYLSSEPPAKRRHPDDRRSDAEQRDNASFNEWLNNDKIAGYDQLLQDASRHLEVYAWKCASFDSFFLCFTLFQLQMPCHALQPACL